jgi:Chaperone of endosialidase
VPRNHSSARAIGVQALLGNTVGDANTAVGFNALMRNTTGDNNTAVGNGAGANLTIGDDNIDIGNPGVAGENETIRIGTAGFQRRAFIIGIRGVAVTGSTVVVNTSGQLGVLPSSARFKDEIKPMDKASEAILALKPVTFRYKEELDPKGIPQFGLVAEDVEKVNPDLVTRDAKGEIYTVRYEAVNAMLLNEFLKEHRKVEEQAHINQQQEAINSQLNSALTQQQKQAQATAAQQQKEIKALTASLKEQASQIQKVSAQVELNKPAPQMAVNNQ